MLLTAFYVHKCQMCARLINSLALDYYRIFVSLTYFLCIMSLRMASRWRVYHDNVLWVKLECSHNFFGECTLTAYWSWMLAGDSSIRMLKCNTHFPRWKYSNSSNIRQSPAFRNDFIQPNPNRAITSTKFWLTKCQSIELLVLHSDYVDIVTSSHVDGYCSCKNDNRVCCIKNSIDMIEHLNKHGNAVIGYTLLIYGHWCWSIRHDWRYDDFTCSVVYNIHYRVCLWNFTPNSHRNR